MSLRDGFWLESAPTEKGGKGQVRPVVRSHWTDREMLSEIVWPRGPAKTEVKISLKKKMGGRGSDQEAAIQPRKCLQDLARTVVITLELSRALTKRWVMIWIWTTSSGELASFTWHMLGNFLFPTYEVVITSLSYSRALMSERIKSSIPLVDNHINIDRAIDTARWKFRSNACLFHCS